MSSFKDHITEILRAYENQINKSAEIKLSPDRYLTEQYEHISYICKLIAMSANGENPDQVFKIRAINKEYERMEDLTPLDLIIEEAKSWGITDKDFIYRIVTAIPEVDNYDCTYQECINKIGHILHVSRVIINQTITDFIKHADFSKTKYTKIFTKMPKSLITNEVFIDQLLDFCRE